MRNERALKIVYFYNYIVYNIINLKFLFYGVYGTEKQFIIKPKGGT